MQVNLWCSKTDIVGCGETVEIASHMFALHSVVMAGIEARF